MKVKKPKICLVDNELDESINNGANISALSMACLIPSPPVSSSPVAAGQKSYQRLIFSNIDTAIRLPYSVFLYSSGILILHRL